MKAASPGLIAFLNTARQAQDAQIFVADLFTFTLLSGPVLRWTNADYDITFAGQTYSASGPMVNGLKYKCTIGVDVDRQQISVAARQTDLVSGALVLMQIRDGAFDGATVQRERVFSSAPNATIVDSVVLFHGRVSTVDSVGRTQAQLTVASDLVELAFNMPRNVYSPTCLHVLYQAGCGVSAAAFSLAATAGVGSTGSVVAFAGAAVTQIQGTLVFTTGANANVRSTVRSVVPGVSATLQFPLPATPAVGDGFTVFQGCDHTKATCLAKFNNLARFRGFPFVPQPQISFALALVALAFAAKSLLLQAVF